MFLEHWYFLLHPTRIDNRIDYGIDYGIDYRKDYSMKALINKLNV